MYNSSQRAKTLAEEAYGTNNNEEKHLEINKLLEIFQMDIETDN